MLQQLRDATRSIHDELEQLSGVDKIMDQSIDRTGYERILEVNYHTYATVEKKIAPYLSVQPISSRIAMDLNHPPSNNAETFNYHLHSKDEALGAKYVLEGSMLGASLIARALQDCVKLQPLSEQHFYKKATKESMADWPSLMNELKEVPSDSAQAQDIITGALRTFNLFKRNYLQLRA
ncbi:biliverdin-producing heme oxygenase [Nonlabens xiamenensis]|uniref:biliverdin-producing heme oxygenase n=1 Tax=Nonlabens xiamenensis TaxID=2341043 RepID=UPI000F6125D6|nr:biliverdin-producing heme oxygenase [Nonlabens xiamenensis]